MRELSLNDVELSRASGSGGVRLGKLGGSTARIQYHPLSKLESGPAPVKAGPEETVVVAVTEITGPPSVLVVDGEGY